MGVVASSEVGMQEMMNNLQVDNLGIKANAKKTKEKIAKITGRNIDNHYIKVE